MRDGLAMSDVCGFKIIGEMSKEELIDEILSINRSLLSSAELDNLRLAVIRYRLEEVQVRLVAESGIDMAPRGPQGLLGGGSGW